MRVSDHEVKERAKDRFFLLLLLRLFHHLLDPRMRQNANRVTLAEHSLPIVEAIELIVFIDDYIQVNNKYDFDFVSQIKWRYTY